MNENSPPDLGRFSGPLDLRTRADYFKQLADQGDASGQCFYGICLQDGLGFSKDLKGAA
jgi:TPR repeat protein